MLVLRVPAVESLTPHIGIRQRAGTLDEESAVVVSTKRLDLIATLAEDLVLELGTRDSHLPDHRHRLAHVQPLRPRCRRPLPLLTALLRP